MEEYKREWLNRYITRKRSLDRLYTKLANKRADAYSPRSPVISDMPKAWSASNYIEETAAEVELLEKRISRLEPIVNKIRWEIVTAIDNVGDPVLAEILERRFIYGQSIEEISDELGYTSRHCWRLYSAAGAAIEIPPEDTEQNRSQFE